MDATPRTAGQPWLESVSRLADLGLLLVDADRRVTFISDRARVMLGCAADAAPDACAAPVCSALNAALVEGGDGAVPYEVELADEASDRPPHHLRLEVQPVEGVTPAMYVVLLRDLDREERARESERLATHSRDLAHLHRALAHDLRTPSASALLYLQLLANTFAQDADAPPQAKRQGEYLGVIRDGVRTLDAALKTLLDTIAPERPDPQAFELQRVVQDAAQLLQPQAKAQGVAVRQDMPTEPVRVVARRDRFKHALLSLAVNALEAMPGGGTLQVTLTREEDTATLTLADTGPGIRADLQPHVMERHVTSKPYGSGLGLPIAQRVIADDGGRLTLTTSPDEGTRVAITLPLAAD